MNVFNSQNEFDVLVFDIALLGRGYKVSRNFTLGEYASKDGHNIVLIHPSLMLGTQALRDHTRRKVFFNSAYRSPAHNKAIGGATNSLHVKGMAADIVIDGMTPIEVASLAHDIGLGGIKAYPTFTHIDVGVKRSW